MKNSIIFSISVISLLAFSSSCDAPSKSIHSDKRVIERTTGTTRESPTESARVYSADAGKPPTSIVQKRPEPEKAEPEPEPEPEGPDEDSIENAIQAMAPSIKSCLPPSAMERDETSISVSVTIHTTGRVLNADVSGMDMDRSHRTCILKILLNMRFKPFDGDRAHVYSSDLLYKKQKVEE